MSELAKFRIVRAPKNYEPTDESALRYPRPNDKSRLDQFMPSPPIPPDSQAKLPSDVLALLVRPRAPQLGDPSLTNLRALNQWLSTRNDDHDAEGLTSRLSAWATDVTGHPVQPAEAAATLIASPKWIDLRAAVGDSILIQTASHENADDLHILCAWFLVIGFIERVAGLDHEAIEALDLRLYLLYRLILIPPRFILPRTTLLGTGSLFARQPAFTDFVVVREEWSCFQPGEIAHIENVLRGENKTRTHVRTDQTTTTLSEETERIQLDERDTQSTDRASFQEEVSRQTELAVGAEGQVNLNASYGPVEIETSFGASLSYSSAESHRRANEVSREVVARSLNRVEESVARKRASVSLNRVVETNRHVIDNSANPATHVVGIYRWVDKISRLQVFTYPHRFVLEFQIPEPGAYLRWLAGVRPSVEVDIAPPPDFVNVSGEPLRPDHITAATYMALVATFKAPGQLAPPEPTIHISSGADLSAAEALPNGQDSRIEFVPAIAGSIEFAVADGYMVTQARMSLAAVPILAKWRDQEIQDRDGDIDETYYAGEILGYHEIVAGVTIGGQQSVVPSASWITPTIKRAQYRPGGGKPWGYGHREAWFEASTTLADPAGMGSGQFKAQLVVSGALRVIASVNLTCTLTAGAFQEWQLESFDRLREAHAAWERRYREAVSAQEIIEGIDIPGSSPETNRLAVRDELKRQVIEMLLGHRFDGLDLVEVPATGADPALGPSTRLAGAVENAPIVQFLEQVFEWSNLSYILYPYYWATRSRWPELVPIEGADPAFAEFLRSGSARVVVPARPGFETDVLAFSVTGLPWRGGPMPMADDDERFISVAEEIRDRRGAPDDGVPGDLWEARQPTTLVWLDDDSSLPKHNDRRRLVGTPLIDLCSERRP